MKKRTIFLTAIVASLQAVVAGAPEIEDAERALAEKVPEVAIPKLEHVLTQPIAGEERSLAEHMLVRALIATGRAQEAVEVSEKFSDDEGKLLRAEAFVASVKWSEAAPLYREIAAHDGAEKNAATLGLAEALEALGNPTDAARTLENFKPAASAPTLQLRLAEIHLKLKNVKRAEQVLATVTPQSEFEKKWKKYLEARVLLARDQAAPALAALEEILHQPRGMTERLLTAVTVADTDARTALNGREAADNVLEDFIWQHPQSAFLEEMFARLDEIYAGEDNASEAELQKWAAKPPRRRAAFALFYLARSQIRSSKPDKALRSLINFVREYPGHPLLWKACAMQGELLLDDKPAAAVTAFEAAMRNAADAETLAQMEIAAGTAHFRQREFLLAVNSFRSAAQHSPARWQEAIFDSALAWLNLGNYEKFLVDYQELSARSPESAFRRDLLLEEGLLQARSHDARATATLQLFLRDFPDHPRAHDARIALAEIAFISSDNETAGRLLKVANDVPGGQESERGDYLAIFVADAEKNRDDGKVIALCNAFFGAHPGSALSSEVRMKLGQIYFRREDFANAQTQFETLATDAAEMPLAETALFLAGQSAMRSMNPEGVDHALELFQQVAKLNGPLKLYAREQQAIAKTRLGKTAEALVLYDAILRANPEGSLRFAALCGKAGNLAAPGDPTALAKAVAVYDQLAAEPDVTAFWRNQALYKKAKCVEKSDKGKALEVLYSVLQPQIDAEPEYFWFYKAGFDAARLLETDEKWTSAIAIYEKMAKAEGPRSSDARDRAEQLRLEHFIWE
ncbi:MAG: hypothetical protein QOD99_1796 [Chthoniobacter sp.]|jgi:TolA-binding protein|nr:hypothetical protein [Chthoniobacter sp.]